MLGSFSLEVMDPENISGWKDDDEFSGSERRGENIILYDWFAMTSRIDSVDSLIAALGLKYEVKWQETYGFYGYKSRLNFDGINIHYNHCDKASDFPLLELTGQGCRDFETYTDGNWNRLFNLALDTENYNITRLDVAYDDHNGMLDIEKITKKTLNREFCAISQKGILTDSFSRNVDAWSVMFGVRSSEIYTRIYDKAKERGYTDGRHWVRCETVLKHDRALNFIKNQSPIGQKYCGVLKNYLRFVQPDKNDSNKRRWKTCKWWSDFLGSCDVISLNTPKNVDYNLSRLGRYVFHQAGNSIDTYIQCVGLTKFLDDLKIRSTRLNVHQKRIIEEYRQRIIVEQNQCNSNFPAFIPAAADDWVTRGLKNED